MVLALDDLLDNRTEEFREDGDADGVDEGCEEHPPVLVLDLILAKLIPVLHQDCRR